QDVLQGVVQRMAQVERPGDIRGWDHNTVRPYVAGRIGVEIAPTYPELVPTALGVLGIVLFGEVWCTHARIRNVGQANDGGRMVKRVRQRPAGRNLRSGDEFALDLLIEPNGVTHPTRPPTAGSARSASTSRTVQP